MTQAPPTHRVPTHVPPELVREFDHHAEPAAAPDCFSPFDRLYGTRVFWSPLHGGFWVLTRAQDISDALHRPDVFSSHPVGIPAMEGYPRKLIPEELDPPEHGKYRKPLAEPFAPNAVAGMADDVDRTCVGLIEPLVSRGECEFLADFAKPFPTMIFTKMLGLPPSEAGKFIEWTHRIIHVLDPQVRQEAGGATTVYLMDLIAQRAAHPEHDLVSHLLGSRIDGRPMTREEVLDTCFLLFMAGLDTVTASLGFMFRFLAEHDDHRRQLVENPDIAPAAVEELLRVHAVVNPTRTVVEDTELCGVEVRKGQRILISTALATRDPEAYGDACEVRFDRKPNNHIAFGAGPHRCLGSHLARKELAIALVEWHRRIPDYRVAAEPTIKAHAGGVLGIDVLPLQWDV